MRRNDKGVAGDGVARDGRGGRGRSGITVLEDDGEDYDAGGGEEGPGEEEELADGFASCC